MRNRRKFFKNRPFPKYVPPTQEQIDAQNVAIKTHNDSLPKPVPYLTPEDPNAFLNMVKMPCPPTKYYQEFTAECPKCHGYGGWHLRLNAYGEGKHFNCICSQCTGWGCVKPGRDVECVHEWREISSDAAAALGIPHYGMCYHVYKCAKGCGATMAHDSSD